MINNWNLDRGIQAQDASTVTWKAVTTGNYGAIDLWLETSGGLLAFKTAPVSGAVAIAELGVDPVMFAGWRPGACSSSCNACQRRWTSGA